MPDILFKLCSRVVGWYQATAARRLREGMGYCAPSAQVAADVFIWGAEAFSIDRDSVVNARTFIYASGGVSIGCRVMIGAGTLISSVTHPLPSAGRRLAPLVTGQVVIEDDVWVGMGALVLPGVRIGKGAVVAAGAVVTRDVPADTLVAGCPARVMRSITGDAAPRG